MVLCMTLKYRRELQGKRKMRSLYKAKPQWVYVIGLLALEWLQRPTVPLRMRSLVKTSDGFRFTTRMYLSVFEPNDCQTQWRFVVFPACKCGIQSTLWLSVYLPSLDPVSARLILHFTLWSKWGANFLVEDYLKFKFKLTFLIYCNLVCLFPADNRYSVSLQKCNDQSFTGTWSLSLTSLTCSET